MKKLLAAFLFLLIFQTVDAQTDRELADILRERVAVGKTNQSIVVAVIDERGMRFVSEGKSAETIGAKISDENTVFEIGSITKVFTGTLLAEAVRRGEVRLDDPIAKYLPPNVKTPTRGGKEITLLDLATQSSGLPGLPANFAPKDWSNPYADYSVAQMYDFLSGYQFPSNDFFTITRSGDKLFAQLTGQSRLRVFAESEQKFYYKVVDARLTFNRNANGKVESLTLSQNGDQLARKIE